MSISSNHPFPLKGVIFDLGNTLIYFDSDWPSVAPQANAALLSALRQAGIRIPDTDFEVEIDRRLDAYYHQREAEFSEYTIGYVLRALLSEKGYAQLSEEEIKPILQARFAISQAHWQPEKDTIPTLEALRSQGYRLAIISNASDDADVQVLIDKAGIRPYFDTILTSAAIGIRKPHPRIFKTVLDQLSLLPEQAAMVGDTLSADILGAQSVGMRSVWITRRADRNANRLFEHKVQPDAVVAALSQLPGLFAAWDQAPAI